MVKSRHGKEWTKEEDKKLEHLFNTHHSFAQMGKELGRTWFACKCRLARLELIPPFRKKAEEGYGLIGDMEPYRVPNPEKIDFIEPFKELEKMCFGEESQIIPCGCCSGHIDSEDTSNTFSNAELNIITDWLKTRLSSVVCRLADGDHCFMTEVELKTTKEFLETEIQVANNMKKITVKEREKVLKRLC